MLFLHKRNLLNPRKLINETMKKMRFSMREEKMKVKDQNNEEKRVKRQTKN